MKTRKPKVTYTLTADPEHLSIPGNVMSSGDDAADRAAEEDVIRDLESGNEWAWCCAHVRAEFQGFTGDAYLGGCSYRNAEEFMAPGGYYRDMCREALDDLRDSIKDAIWRGEDAIRRGEDAKRALMELGEDK